jgi:hypothetical protein
MQNSLEEYHSYRRMSDCDKTLTPNVFEENNMTMKKINILYIAKIAASYEYCKQIYTRRNRTIILVGNDQIGPQDKWLWKKKTKTCKKQKKM